MSQRCCRYLSIVAILSALGLARAEQPPGVVINYIPSRTQVYVGSPGIAVLPNGHYLAKHDEFGPKSTENTEAVTPVFRSVDRGLSWQRVATVKGMYWASIFVHKGDAYLIGTSKNHGFVVISRSRDEGVTWTMPKDKSSGLLLDDAQVPLCAGACRGPSGPDLAGDGGCHGAGRLGQPFPGVHDVGPRGQ